MTVLRRPGDKLAMEPAATRALSRAVDRDHRLEHGHLDAGCGRRLVDDVALIVAVDGGARRSQPQTVFR